MEEEQAATEAGLVPASEPAPRPPRSGSSLPVFAAITALALASFAGAALVLGGAGRIASTTEPTDEPGATSAPARTAGATAGTAAVGRVRVVSATGRSRPTDNTGRQHEVSFSWVLEGARENDEAVVQFYQGTQALGQQSGTLDPSVFSFTTGTLTLTADLECSTGGWSAEILTIRGAVVDGEAEARAPGVACP